MNKKILILLLVLVVFFNGCNNPNVINKSNKITVNIDETNISKSDVFYFTEGKFSTNSINDSAMIVVDNESKAHLVIKSNNTIYTLYIKKVEKKPFDTGRLINADVDNDGVDELLFWGEINGNGYTIASIFKLVDGEINLIVDLNQRRDITYSYIDNKKLLIQVNSIEYSETIDLTKVFPSTCFNSDGQYIGNSKVVELPINNLDVITTPKNENVTMICFSRGIKINNYLGRFKIFLNYDKKSAQFIICDINFEEYRTEDNQGRDCTGDGSVCYSQNA